jgi:hypothetical protein
MVVAALGEGASETEQKHKPGNREMAQDCVFGLVHPSTHEFPELSSPCGHTADPFGDAGQIGPQYGGDLSLGI